MNRARLSLAEQLDVAITDAQTRGGGLETLRASAGHRPHPNTTISKSPVRSARARGAE